MNNSLKSLSVITTFLLVALLPSTFASSKSKPLVFKTVVIVKEKTDLNLNGKQIKSNMTKEDIAAITRVYKEYCPAIIKKLSNGQIAWDPEVIISKHPLTSLTYMKSYKTYWPSESDVAKDIETYITPGKYDTFSIYYKPMLNDGTRLIPVHFDFGISPRSATNHAGMSVLQWKDPKQLTLDTASTEAFIHEWLHNLEYFYQPLGVELPEGGLHGAETNGYSNINRTWKKWYGDFLQGKVKGKDGKLRGLGEKAWAKGTIRDYAMKLTPEYAAKYKKAKNLLPTITKDWTTNGWKDVPKSPKGKMKGRSSSLIMECPESNHLRYQKSVKLKPNTPYLFSASVSTEDIKITEDKGKVGAAIAANGKDSISVSGTKTKPVYSAVMFTTGGDGMANLVLRIGHNGSIAKGKAEFGDIRLVELKE